MPNTREGSVIDRRKTTTPDVTKYKIGDELNPEDFEKLSDEPSNAKSFRCECGRKNIVKVNTKQVECGCGSIWDVKPGFVVGRGEYKGLQISFNTRRK